MGELCTFSKGHGYSKADIRDAGTPLILYGRLYTQYESRIENVDTFAVEQEGSLLSKGNEVIVPASGETAEDIAVASSVRRSGIIFGGDLNVVTPVSKLDPDYIALAITYSKAHDDLAKRAQGKSVVHVHGNDIAEVEIPYPSESEQKRISTVVLGLDSLITLHQRKCQYHSLCGYLLGNSVSWVRSLKSILKRTGQTYHLLPSFKAAEPSTVMSQTETFNLIRTVSQTTRLSIPMISSFIFAHSKGDWRRQHIVV